MFSGFEPSLAFVTTTYILAECANAFARSDLRSRLVVLADGLDAQRLLIFPTDADWSAAWAGFSRDHPGSPSLTDQLSFAVMRRLGLRRAFTNDGHFDEAGFEALF